MKREIKIITTVLLTLNAVLLLQGGSIMAQEQLPSGVVKVTRTKTEWEKNFAQSDAVRRANNGVVAVHPGDLAAISTAPDSLLAVVCPFDADGFLNNDLWIAQPRGKNPKRVATELRRSIRTVQWSPNSKYLAYVSEPTGSVAHRKTLTDLSMIDVQSDHVTLIAENGALNPQWTADGSELVFWKHEGDGWRPYQASQLASDKLRIEAVSKMTCSEPGTLSPNGQQVAGIQGGQLITENVSTHQRRSYSLSKIINGRLSAQNMEWSQDDQWIYFWASVLGFESSNSISFALNLTDSKLVGFTERLVSLVTPKKDERIQIGALGWIPGKSTGCYYALLSNKKCLQAFHQHSRMSKANGLSIMLMTTLLNRSNRSTFHLTCLLEQKLPGILKAPLFS
jgi:hypothetical protein